MKTLSRLFFLTLAAMAWHPAFALDNKNVDLDSADTMNAINPSGANMLDNDVIANTGTPPPLIVISEGSMYDQAGLAYFSFGQNGHYRDSVATVPPLIHALSLDKVMDLSSNAISGVDLAGGTMYDTSQTNDGWSDSGAQSTGTVIPAVNTVPPEIPAPQSA